MNKYLYAILVVFATSLVAGCSSSDDDDNPSALAGLSLLEQACYLREADAAQPQWLQQEIAASPYLLVYRSNDDRGLYLLHYPQSGQAKLYRAGAVVQQGTTENVDQMARAGHPWTCIHIYSFPLYPGDAEWDLDKYTPDQMKEKLLLPERLLREMRTPDLLEVCLDYQYKLDFLLHDNLQTGFDYQCSEFNGYGELFQRSDLPGVILQKQVTHWRKMEALKSLSDLERGDYSFQCDLFKMILAQDEFLDRLDAVLLRQLIDTNINNTNMELAEGFGYINYVTSLYLYARIVQRQGGFMFASEEERKLFELFASTCTLDYQVQAIFTEEFQQRLYDYLDSL